MKKLQLVWLGLVLLFATSGVLFAQQLTLDNAVKEAAREIEGRLEANIKVVVLNFRAPTARFSNYVIDEMMTELVNGGKLQVVDRHNLELIRSEMNFQMSGDVSDTSAQQIGQMLGAQSIVSGNIEDMGNNQWRIRFRVIAVETARVQAMPSRNVRTDAQITTLMRDAGGTTTTTQQQARAAAPARPQSSTPYPRGLNYSGGRKFGAGILNMAFGIGSLFMGDFLGMCMIAGIQIVGIVLVVRPEPNYWDYDHHWEPWRYEDDYNLWITLVGVGAGVWAAGIIYGFIRPFTYDVQYSRRRGTYLGWENSNPIEHISFAPIVSNGSTGMSLVYSASY